MTIMPDFKTFTQVMKAHAQLREEDVHDFVDNLFCFVSKLYKKTLRQKTLLKKDKRTRVRLYLVTRAAKNKDFTDSEFREYVKTLCR